MIYNIPVVMSITLITSELLITYRYKKCERVLKKLFIFVNNYLNWSYLEWKYINKVFLSHLRRKTFFNDGHRILLSFCEKKVKFIITLKRWRCCMNIKNDAFSKWIIIINLLLIKKSGKIDFRCLPSIGVSKIIRKSYKFSWNFNKIEDPMHMKTGYSAIYQ